MFGSIGGTEILIILVIALVVFGPKRLPELGRTIGKGLGEFRRASNDLKRSLEEEITLDERRSERTESPDTD
jgi:TatA/E family protein of Tat protein translocase